MSFEQADRCANKNQNSGRLRCEAVPHPLKPEKTHHHAGDRPKNGGVKKMLFARYVHYGKAQSMRLGLDILLTQQRELLQGKKIGILSHQASLNSQGKHIIDLLTAEKKAWQVTTLFGPEHGVAGKAQYMEPVESTTHTPSGLPLHSLYGKSLKNLSPTKAMLKNIDCLVIDLQDVGSRYYTYVWTALLCIEACGKNSKEVIVCDRPNPINGVMLEGELNNKGYTSFVGLYPLPVRHGMTIGEIAHFINDTHDLGCNLKIVPMEGWHREWYWEETGLKWINPSPNIRSPLQALLYPGMCLLEGTNISEGRGTDFPFELAGAPFIQPTKLIEALGEFNLEGIEFAPAEFTPASDQKLGGKLCKGVRFKVTDRKNFKPYATGLAFLWALYYLYNEEGFQWRFEPYEFIEDIPAVDLLTGGATVRQAIEKHLPLSELLEWVGNPPESFLKQIKPYLLY